MVPTIAYLNECFVCDADRGILTWRNRPEAHFLTSKDQNRWNAIYAGKRAGTLEKIGYRQIKLMYEGRQLTVRAHRVILAMANGSWPILDVDHINRDKSDDRIENLREASDSENLRNACCRRDNVTGLKGVSAHRDKFQAKITIHGKTIYLGSFNRAENAHQAYCVAAKKYHGAFARTS